MDHVFAAGSFLQVDGVPIGSDAIPVPSGAKGVRRYTRVVLPESAEARSIRIRNYRYCLSIPDVTGSLLARCQFSA